MAGKEITSEIETEAAIWAEGTKYTASDIIRAYREHLTTADEPLDIQRFCQNTLGIAASLDWYWIDGTAYCPACVDCESPAIDTALATRGPCLDARCGCCGKTPNAND